MALENISPVNTKSWKNLTSHFKKIKNEKINDFLEDKERLNKLTISWENFYFDFSKNRLNQDTINALINLANECDLQHAIEAQFSGKKINVTEDRSVLHTACRCSTNDKIIINNIDIVPDIIKNRTRIKSFTESILSGEIVGKTNKKFTDVVNIGIGGSDLGPQMVTEALGFYKNHINSHFISNVDGDHVQNILKKLDAETTLFIIVSKTFTTKETITNAKTIKSWFISEIGENYIEDHFVAVSNNEKEVQNFGIKKEFTFSINDWVGGRFSVWSSVGLVVSISIGFDNYEKLLIGARLADNHFKKTQLDKNIPVLMGLISLWYNNFFGCESEAIISYSEYLQKLPSYLQQASMESNGKNVDRNGKKVTHQTGNIIWGGTGTNSQHAFFQLLHQGTKLIPCDFIGFKTPLYSENDQHDILMSNFFAQTQALLNGKGYKIVKSELEKNSQNEDLAPFKSFDGNRPSNSILIDKLTPEALGSLIAFYEHKIFVLGIIWNIYSFDQWGVELGKELASSLLDDIRTKKSTSKDLSTKSLINNYNKG